MSERLLGALQDIFTGHGIAAERSGAAIHAQDGLKIEPRVFERGEVQGTVQVQVDFAIESPRLSGIPFLDSFAGIGETHDQAEINAGAKFMQGSFHVLAEALTTHRCDHPQADWEEWQGAGFSWRVCTGPVLMISTRSGTHIEGLPEFMPQLTGLFCATMSAGPHWLRLFLGTLDGKHTGSEVLVDGAVWAGGQALLDAHAWIHPPGYASLRLLLIALPPAA